MLGHEQINDAVVIAKESTAGDKRLIGYIVSDVVDESALVDSTRQYMTKQLPDYMVPSAFVVLDSLPLTPNGKVDRKGLPEPDMALHQKEYVAPSTETEQVLCDIWQEVLGIERVGVTDNFFELGGHSLLATRLVSIINQTFNVELPLKTLFSEPILKSVADVILTLDNGLTLPELVRIERRKAEPLLLSYTQQRLWMLDQIDGGSAHYNMPGGLKLSGKLDNKALDYAFTIIMERHESLRTCFHVGENEEPIQVVLVDN